METAHAEIYWDNLPDPQHDPSWELVSYTLREGETVSTGEYSGRKTTPLMETIRAVGKTPQWGFLAETGNVGNAMFQGRQNLNSMPLDQRSGGVPEHNSDANRVRTMVLSDVLVVYKRDGIGHQPAAVMFMAGPNFPGLYKQLEAPSEKAPNPVKLDTARTFTEGFADDWHNNAPPLGTYPALRDSSSWDPITATFERVGSVGPSPGETKPQFRFVRRSPIPRRAGLRDYTNSSGAEMGLVLDEMATHPEPSEGDHIVEALRFLHPSDTRSVLSWLQGQTKDDERRMDVVADLMLDKLEPEDIIVRAIEGIWPGRANGKHRRNAYESLRLFVAEVITNVIAHRAGSILLAGPLT